ncbi:hypothetical protein H8527_00660 [Alloprevotella sp. Lung230]|nr:hypothetical protein [Alloprevotella sp. Lung230]
MALLERDGKRFVAICRISRSADRLKRSVLRTEILQICSNQGSYYFGYKLHVICGLSGVIHSYYLSKASVIETINDMLKNVAQIVHTRHRSVSNFIVNLLAGMAAYAFYDTKPSINMEFEMEGETEVKQLTLF